MSAPAARACSAQTFKGELIMRHVSGSATLVLAGLAGLAAGLVPAARADVTVQERSTFDFTIIKAQGTTTELTTADKQRRDSDFHCEGFMSLFCGNTQSAEITRLDREVTWALEPKKKEYRETRFPTAAEREAAAQEAQALIEKMKQCPAPKTTTTAAPDTSHCEMTPAKVDVKKTDQHAIVAGHDTQLTQIALTQSCHNKDTGDTCDFVMSFDSWLTQDEIPGSADRKAFQAAYMHKLGLDEQGAAVQKQMRQFLAPYAGSLKELSAKAGDLKGYPLKTSFRVAFGGEHCGAAKQGQHGNGSAGSNPVGDAGQAAGDAAASSAASTAQSEASSAAAHAAGNSVGGSILNSAAGAFGNKLVGSLFAKKKPAPTATSTGANAAPASNMLQAVEMTIETTSITTGPIAASQFDIPAGWKLLAPQSSKPGKEFSCPNPGT